MVCFEVGANMAIIFGTNGADTLSGTSGSDTILAGNGDDVVNGDAGNDVIDGGSGNDTLVGGAGADILLGGIGHDLLDGGSDSDILLGGSGDDTLLGRAGDDFLDGGNGSDTAGYALDTLGVIVDLVAGTASGAEAGNDTLVSMRMSRAGLATTSSVAMPAPTGCSAATVTTGWPGVRATIPSLAGSGRIHSSSTSASARTPSPT